jgi:hypothetical protein
MLTYGPVRVERVKPEESSASVYLRSGRIIFHGDCLTTIGGLACEPYRRIDAAASNAEVGSALIGVLVDARITPIPIDHKAEQQKILRAVGVRSWSKLSDGAINCSVRQSPHEISILPTRKEGRAFFHLPQLTVRVPIDSTPEQIGRALREGFQRCV